MRFPTPHGPISTHISLNSLWRYHSPCPHCPILPVLLNPSSAPPPPLSLQKTSSHRTHFPSRKIVRRLRNFAFQSRCFDSCSILVLIELPNLNYYCFGEGCFRVRVFGCGSRVSRRSKRCVLRFVVGELMVVVGFEGGIEVWRGKGGLGTCGNPPRVPTLV